MSFNTTLRAGATAAVIALLSISPMTAKSGYNSAKQPRLHRAHHAIYRGERLPYAPEYGFLTHVPPKAMRMPGYTFVPGKGIIGESCDLPTSACSNQYRDVQ
jgi:hypothetical protein